MGPPEPPRWVSGMDVTLTSLRADRRRGWGGNLGRMTVVKINAIEVPPGAGPELEKRFAHRAHAVDNQPGFLGFQLLRPVKGEDR